MGLIPMSRSQFVRSNPFINFITRSSYSWKIKYIFRSIFYSFKILIQFVSKLHQLDGFLNLRMLGDEAGVFSIIFSITVSFPSWSFSVYSSSSSLTSIKSYSSMCWCNKSTTFCSALFSMLKNAFLFLREIASSNGVLFHLII